MIEVYKYSISKQQLDSIPIADRDLILLAGHALNATNAWLKLLRLSSNNPSDETPQGIGSTYQSHMITRSLYGHIVEASNWLNRGSTKALIETYLPDLDGLANDAYKEIRQRLDDTQVGTDAKGVISPILVKLRNQFGFHFPKPNALQKAYEYIGAEEDWSLYISEEHSNSCYWISELVVGLGSLSLTEIKSPQEAFSLVVQETIKAANALNQFLVGLMPAVFHRYLPKPALEVLFVVDAANGKDFKLPFYCEGI